MAASELLVLSMPANIVIISSPEQRFYPKFWCFSVSGVSVQALKLRPCQRVQSQSKAQTCWALMLHQLEILLKIRLQICFKWLCRVHEISVFILDSGKKEVLWGCGWNFTGAAFCSLQELPMEGLRSLGEMLVVFHRKTCVMGLLGHPQRRNMETLSSAQGAEPSSYQRLLQLGDDQWHGISLICSMTRTFFFTLVNWWYYPLLKWCYPLS